MLKVFIITILILPNIVFANATKAINYKITPNFTNIVTPHLIIEAEFSGDFKGDVSIDLPYHWAGWDYHKQIRNIKLLNPLDNTKLSVKLDKNNSGYGDYLVSITTKGTNKIALSYEVHLTVFILPQVVHIAFEDKLLYFV